MRRHLTWADRCAALALIFGLVGAVLGALVEHGVLCAMLGVITGVFVGFMIWQQDKMVEREYAKTWTRIFCPVCQELWGSVRKGAIVNEPYKCGLCGTIFTVKGKG